MKIKSFFRSKTLLFSLLCLDDGALRIWKNFADQKNPEMVTAWQGLSDMLPTTRGQPPHHPLTPNTHNPALPHANPIPDQ